jgi:predicted kinase
VGPVAVGKTTLAKYISSKLPFQIVSDDSIRFEKFQDPTYSISENNYVYQQSIGKIRSMVLDGKSVIYDGINLTSFWRTELKKSIIQIADLITLLLYIPEQELNKRLDERDRAISVEHLGYTGWRQVFESLSKRFDMVNNPYLVYDGTTSADGLIAILSRLI